MQRPLPKRKKHQHPATYKLYTTFLIPLEHVEQAKPGDWYLQQIGLNEFKVVTVRKEEDGKSNPVGQP